MRFQQLPALCVLTLCMHRDAKAAEPNETFATATVLSAGVLQVSDVLEQPPDTLLGLQGGIFGDIYAVDDDGSEFGGTASGYQGAAVESGQIRFSVTGFPDEFFNGDHGQFGPYDVYVDVYDSFGDPIDSFVAEGDLDPGVVDPFTFSNFEWFGGTYDVNIDNTVGFLNYADIDFFTFTGLTPGAAFTAETLDPTNSDVDTLLGWFNGSGSLIGSDDDAGVDVLSKLSGVVPAAGALTFAVTGTGDASFEGLHFEPGAYDLKLTLSGGGFAADFTGDNRVNAADLTAWRAAFGPSAAANADGDLDSDGNDFLIWQRQLGSGAAVVAAGAVPEPRGLPLACATAAGLSALRRTRPRHFQHTYI